ncbi:hypothetical protein CUR178_00788 [Leishmania enriettii]|uniref:Uncharacterized protein n=1 Tax=Leishmania enriettii TaxID=5663 RepID=A0A836GGG4_LEIEN|nr:hypothetical protein CUR178_00788 [Leishmania enriettii]
MTVLKAAMELLDVFLTNPSRYTGGFPSTALTSVRTLLSMFVDMCAFGCRVFFSLPVAVGWRTKK